MLADMKDAKNNKTSTQNLTDLKVRVHGDLAVSTYSTTYDAMIHGQHQARTVLCTDGTPTAERRLEADGEPLLSSGQVGGASRAPNVS